MASVHCEKNIRGGKGGKKKASSDTRCSWQSRRTYLAQDEKRRTEAKESGVRESGEVSRGGEEDGKM